MGAADLFHCCRICTSVAIYDELKSVTPLVALSLSLSNYIFANRVLFLLNICIQSHWIMSCRHEAPSIVICICYSIANLRSIHAIVRQIYTLSATISRPLNIVLIHLFSIQVLRSSSLLGKCALFFWPWSNVWLSVAL